ncbi:hypothetical protein HDU82_002510 [Entophlyctis luteolus]|nr:hypothetical protein HDU82_002510 [Entophlyctis luteolus]
MASPPAAKVAWRLLPTAQMVFGLAPAECGDAVGGYFVHTFGDVKAEACATETYRLFGKISSICETESENGRKLRRIVIMDATGQECSLLLRDADAAIADLLDDGADIGILAPWIGKTSFATDREVLCEMECGFETVLFSSFRPAPQITESQPDGAASLPVDADGYRDFSLFPSRFTARHIGGYQKNIHLLGKIVHLTSNMPVEKAGKRCERYGVRVAEDDGRGETVDITLWDACGAAARMLEMGQVVFMDGLRTTASKSATSAAAASRGRRWCVVGSGEFGSRVFCVSRMSALATSRSMVQRTLGGGGFMCVRAVVCGWDAAVDGTVVFTECSLHETSRFERFAHILPHMHDLSSYKCNGTTDRLRVFVHGMIAEGMLGISGTAFHGLEQHEQVALLDGLSGREFDLVVTAYNDKKSGVRVLRADVAVLT